MIPHQIGSKEKTLKKTIRDQAYILLLGSRQDMVQAENLSANSKPLAFHLL